VKVFVLTYCNYGKVKFIKFFEGGPKVVEAGVNIVTGEYIVPR
jgi:hypothetical protein